MEALKFSVLMPTYNDAEHIRLSIDSVLAQGYENWELIIVNDGSTDDTETIVRQYIDPRISYLYQENADQLNALERASQTMTGDIVLLLHSDDMIVSNDSFAQLAETFRSNPSLDGCYADLIVMDSEGVGAGTLRAMPFHPVRILKTVIHQRAGNPLFDPFSVRREVFDRQVRPHYLRDNTIYFINYASGSLLRLRKTSPWYRYRIFGGNYVHSEIGKYVTLSGQFRTIHKLIKSGFTMLPNGHSNTLFHRISCRLKLFLAFPLIRRKDPGFRFARRYYVCWEKQLSRDPADVLLLQQIRRIVDSLCCRVSKSRYTPLVLRYGDEFLYCGKDSRQFFQDYTAGNLNGFYRAILTETYDHIVVEDQRSEDAARAALLFFSFFYEVVQVRPTSEVP